MKSSIINHSPTVLLCKLSEIDVTAVVACRISNYLGYPCELRYSQYSTVEMDARLPIF